MCTYILLLRRWFSSRYDKTLNAEQLYQNADSNFRPKKIKKKKGLQLHRSLSKPEEPLQNNNTAAVSRLTRDEEAGVGRVKWAVFGAYAESLGSFNFFILISAYVLFEVAAVADNLWMTQWTKDVTPQNSSEYTHVRDYYLGVYGGLGIVQGNLSRPFYI